MFLEEFVNNLYSLLFKYSAEFTRNYYFVARVCWICIQIMYFFIQLCLCFSRNVSVSFKLCNFPKTLSHHTFLTYITSFLSLKSSTTSSQYVEKEHNQEERQNQLANSSNFCSKKTWKNRVSGFKILTYDLSRSQKSLFSGSYFLLFALL